MTEVSELIQRPTLGDMVTLFKLDAGPLGGDVYRFTASANRTEDGEVVMVESASIVFGSDEYQPWPCLAEGYEKSAQGAPARPTLTVANIVPIFQAAVLSFDDLKGAIVTRIRTFERYLSTGAESDPTKYLPLDVHVIDRKVNDLPDLIAWELASAAQQEGLQIPRRPILKGVCPWVYRRWDGETEAFDYSSATCPYDGDTYFTATNASTANPAQDRCSKFLSGCKARFGNDPLPFGGFPGVSRVSF